MITVLVRDTRAFNVQLSMNTVSVDRVLEEFARDRERRRIRIFGVVDAFGPYKSTSGEFTYEYQSIKRRR